MTLAVVVILGLAAYRLTRVLTVDSISDPARAVLYDWAWGGTRDRPTSRGRARGWVYELLTCSHCLGVWVSLAAVAAWSSVGGAPSNFAAWLVDVFAVAGVQSVLVSATGRLER